MQCNLTLPSARLRLRSKLVDNGTTIADACARVEAFEARYHAFIEQLEESVKNTITTNLASLPIGISGLGDLVRQKAEELRASMHANTDLTNTELAIEVAL